MSKIKSQVAKRKIEKILSVFLLLLIFGCKNNQYKPLEIFEQRIEDIPKVMTYIENCDKIIPKKSSKIIIKDLANFYKKKKIKGKEKSEEKLFTIYLYDGENYYRLQINNTVNNKISLNYFKNVAGDYFSYYGEYLIEPKQFERINNIIKTECNKS